MILSSDNHLFRFRTYNDFMIQELTENKIWHSKVDELNDPCENFFNLDQDAIKNLDPKDVALIIKESRFLNDFTFIVEACFLRGELDLIHEILNSTYGKKTAVELVNKLHYELAVASFTKEYDSRLMWGYYGDGMKGVCFVYNKSKLIAEGIEFDDINYVQDTPKIDIFKHLIEMKREVPVSLGTKFLFTKHIDWAKECEVRSVACPDEKDMPKGAKGYLRPLNNVCIDAVIVGSKLSIEKRDSIESLAKKNGIKLFRAKTDFNSYKINIYEVK